jgi:hypothetical protein
MVRAIAVDSGVEEGFGARQRFYDSLFPIPDTRFTQ